MSAWLLAVALGSEPRCTYTPSVWDGERAVAGPRVDKLRSALSTAERGPFGCTPCEQDQRTARLSNGLELTACHVVIDDLVSALDDALAAGATVGEVSGYRPVRSRGPVDASGRRTAWSDHAFGLALDVDPAHNGLYDQCPSFGPGCELRHGGPWRPATDPRSLTPEHPVVTALGRLQWAWGGALDGAQKDFMHFAAPSSTTSMEP